MTTIMGMTTAGLELLAKSQSGKIVTFTKMKVGDGTITTETLADMEDLINSVDTLDIKTSQVLTDENDNVSLKITSYVKQYVDGYYFREMGLFAKDPDTQEEVLYAYVNKGEDATYIPEITSSIAVQELASMIVAIGNSENIIVNCNTDLGIIEQVEGNGGYSLFDLVLKDHELTYEESEGFGLQGTWVYKTAVTGERYGYEDFYNQCLAEKAEATSIRTTLGNGTLITYNHVNGHTFYNISDKETVDAFYNTFGIAWFYGIDEENERIFLPRNNYYFKGATSNAGAYVAPQLPALSHTHTGSTSSAGSHTHDKGTMNITGSFGYVEDPDYRSPFSGAFSYDDSLHVQAAAGAGDFGCKVNFNAKNGWTGNTNSAGSHSHTITLNSADASGDFSGTTVQPPSVNGLLYIVVGNVRQKNALVINGALNDAITSINTKKTEVLGDITTATNSATGDVASAKESAIADVNSAKESAISTINGKISDASDYATASQNSANLAQQYASIAVRGQIQTDFTQNDSTAADFIKNKPDLTGMVKVAETQILTNKTIDADDNTISNLTLSNLKSDTIATNLIESTNISENKIPTSRAVFLRIEDLENSVSSLSQTIAGATPEWGTGLTDATELRTVVRVTCSNEDLTVTSSYTGVQNNAGDILYQFTFDGENWVDEENNIVTLSSYDLTVTGIPVEDDKIVLVYETGYVTTVNGFDGDYNSLSNKPTIPDISGKEDVNKTMNTLASSGTITLTDNSVNKITPTGNITFTLPTVTDLTVFHQILVQLNLSTVYTFDLGLGATPHYFNKTAPDLSNAGVYNLIFEYDNQNDYWVGGVVTKGVTS